MEKSIKRYFPIFLGPTFLAFLIGFIVPFLMGIYLSFCDFRTVTDAKFIGLGNFVRAFQDGEFAHAFWFTALFTVTTLVLINVIAFAVALVLTREIRGTNIFRTVFFMPNLIGGIVLGYVWQLIFNGILARYDLALKISAKYGFWGLVILVCWQQIGYMMIIHRGPPVHPRRPQRGGGDRRGQRLAEAVERHHPQHDALHHHLHLPDVDQRLQAL